MSCSELTSDSDAAMTTGASRVLNICAKRCTCSGYCMATKLVNSTQNIITMTPMNHGERSMFTGRCNPFAREFIRSENAARLAAIKRSSSLP